MSIARPDSSDCSNKLDWNATTNVPGPPRIHSPRTVPAGCSVGGLLDDAGYGERRVAVEVNGEIVPRSAHGQRVLADGDRVEIVQALGGG